MSDDFTCSECGATAGGTCKRGGPAEPMTPPVANKYWLNLRSQVCAARWEEWKAMEIKIINEYRLNLLEKDHRNQLKKYMTDFLALGGAGAGQAPDAVSANWKPEQG